MATNYTENYQLPLWAADDAFLRTEFNDINEKIDGAIVAGSYTTQSNEPVTVDVGFKPRLVFIQANTSRGYSLATLMEGMSGYLYYNRTYNQSSGGVINITLTSTGFQIPKGTIYLNDEAGNTGHYVAFH